MNVNTKPFGKIDVDERQRLLFPHGIFGFEQLRDFVLLDSQQPPFYWLQSLEEPGLAFVLIEPSFFRNDYVLEIPHDDMEEIQIAGGEDTLIFAIVTIPEDQTKMSANLQGPVVINKKDRIGRQSISTNTSWRVKHYILEEIGAVREKAC